MTLRAVLDANVIVSGLTALPHGETAPPSILRKWFAGEFEIVVSPPILMEVRYALSKPYFLSKAMSLMAEEMIRGLEESTESLVLDGSLTGVASHSHDDRIIETAVKGEVQYLVTGDKELLAVTHPFKFLITRPNIFLAVLEGNV